MRGIPTRLWRARGSLAAPGGYLLMALVMTAGAWVSGPATHWAGQTNDPQKLMNLIGWQAHALWSGQNPLYNPTVNAPWGMNLMWDTSMPLPSALVSPLTLIAGPVFAYNVLLTLMLALDGWCTFLWLRRHVASRGIAFVGGCFLLAGPFTASRAYSQLNMVMLFAIPLMLIVLEDLFFTQRWSVRRTGVLLGLLGAVQLLCTEELVADLVIVYPVVVLCAALFNRAAVRRRVNHAVAALLVAMATGAVIALLPLLFQFRGPDVVHGTLRPLDYWVSDFTNLLVPGHATALRYAQSLTTGWPQLGAGSPEMNAYVGVPLLLLSLVAVWRWRREGPVATAGVVAVFSLLFSLGSHLHVNGEIVLPWLPLPAIILEHSAFLSNILPDRFALFADFALAFLFVTFVARVRAEPGWRKPAGMLLAGLVVLSQLPAVPLTTTAATVPRYFDTAGDVQKLPAGTHVLVEPVLDGSSLFWQMRSGYRVAYTEQDTIARGPGDPYPGYPRDELLFQLANVELGLPASDDPAIKAIMLGELRQRGVVKVIVGPMAQQQAMATYLTALLGSSPVRDQDVEVWSLSAAP